MAGSFTFIWEHREAPRAANMAAEAGYRGRMKDCRHAVRGRGLETSDGRVWMDFYWMRSYPLPQTETELILRRTPPTVQLTGRGQSGPGKCGRGQSGKSGRRRSGPGNTLCSTSVG